MVNRRTNKGLQRRVSVLWVNVYFYLAAVLDAKMNIGNGEKKREGGFPLQGKESNIFEINITKHMKSRKP